MGPVSTTTVGGGTVRVQDDRLVKQASVRRQIGASAANGADEVTGQLGAAR